MLRIWECVLIAILMVAKFSMPTAKAEPLPGSILIINESASDSPFSRRFKEQIHATLDAETARPYTIYAEYLDSCYVGLHRI
jgi:hypothetical protein